MPAFRAKATPAEKLSEDIGTPGNPYPGSYQEPPAIHAVSSVDQIPYRGAEPHGIPFRNPHPAEAYGAEEIYTPGEEMKATQATHFAEPQEFEPVPVRVVLSAPPATMRRRFSTQTIFVPFSATPQRLLSFRPNRTNARITVKKPTATAGNRMYIGNDEGAVLLATQMLDPGDPPFAMNTTDDVWVCPDGTMTGASDLGGAFISIYQEWEIEATSEAEEITRDVPHKHRSEKSKIRA